MSTLALSPYSKEMLPWRVTPASTGHQQVIKTVDQYWSTWACTLLLYRLCKRGGPSLAIPVAHKVFANAADLSMYD